MYSTTGQNTDGPMTQKAVTEGIDKVEVDSIDSMYGYFSHINGSFTVVEATSVYQRKFAVDPHKKYYADVRVVSNTSRTCCGVAYFDSDDKFICGQYDQTTREGAKEYTGVPLNVPPTANYAYIMGYDSIDLGIYPKLYLANKTEQAVVNHAFIEHEVETLTFLGNGSTLAVIPFIKVKPNTLYVFRCNPGVWTMPAPTGTTGGFGVVQYDSDKHGIGDRKVMLQNEYTEAGGLVDGFYFITNPICEYITISARALQNVPIEMTLYEVNNSEIMTKCSPTPNTLIYRTAKIMDGVFENSTGSSSLVTNTIDSAWGVMFPSSYSATGRPTQVIAMFHGGSGWVSPSVMGYEGDVWINWRNAYLNAGFAVMDINGWGISTGRDDHSRHYGCPLAVETIHKAFCELKSKYNICDKIMLHGSSMGTFVSWNYLATHPNNVACVGLFAAACTSYVILKDRENTGISSDSYEKAINSWQYESVSAAVEDNFQRIVGYDPVLRIQDYDEAPATFLTNLVDYDITTLSSKAHLVGASLPCPVRIWHGTNDESLPYSLSQTVVRAYRNGGNNVTLRSCPNLTHNMCTGTTQYVVDEAVEYFSNYRVQ